MGTPHAAALHRPRSACILNTQERAALLLHSTRFSPGTARSRQHSRLLLRTATSYSLNLRNPGGVTRAPHSPAHTPATPPCLVYVPRCKAVNRLAVQRFRTPGSFADARQLGNHAQKNKRMNNARTCSRCARRVCELCTIDCTPPAARTHGLPSRRAALLITSTIVPTPQKRAPDCEVTCRRRPTHDAPAPATPRHPAPPPLPRHAPRLPHRRRHLRMTHGLYSGLAAGDSRGMAPGRHSSPPRHHLPEMPPRRHGALCVRRTPAPLQ